MKSLTDDRIKDAFLKRIQLCGGAKLKVQFTIAGRNDFCLSVRGEPFQK